MHFALALLSFFSAAVVPDPTTEPPIAAQAAAIRDTVEATAYEFRMARNRARYATIAADPDQGLEVIGLDPAGTGKRLGIKVCDVLVKLDGKPIDPAGGGAQFTVPAGKHKLETWSSMTGQAHYHVEGGPLGLDLSRRESRDAMAVKTWQEPNEGAWKDHLHFAILDCDDDPEYAEAALARCKQAGYQGHLLRTLRAVIASNRCEYEDALALGVPEVDKCPPPEQVRLTAALVAAATASGRPRLAAKLLKAHPMADLGDSMDAILACGDLPPPPRAAPIEDFAKRWIATPGCEMNSALVPIGGDTKGPEESITQWKTAHRIGFSVPQAHYITFPFGPTFADAEVEASFMFFPNEHVPALVWNEYALEITDYADINAPRMIAGIHMQLRGDIYFRCAGRAPATIAMGLVFPTCTNSLHLVVIGDECAGFINHDYLFHAKLPNTPGRKLGAHMFFSGSGGQVSGLSWKRLGAGPGAALPEPIDQAWMLVDCKRAKDGDAQVVAALGKDRSLTGPAADYFAQRDKMTQAIAAFDPRNKDQLDAKTCLHAGIYRLYEPASIEDGLKLITEHQSPLADSAMGFVLYASARMRACQDRVLPLLTKYAGQSPYAALGDMWLRLDTGDFSGAEAATKNLVGGKIGGAALISLLAVDRILAPMFGHPIADDSMLEPHFDHLDIEETYRVLFAWLDGDIEDAAAEARCIRCNEYTAFYYFKALRQISLGEHDLARKTLEFLITLGPNGQNGGGAKSLLAWYAKQTPQTLAALPKTTRAKQRRKPQVGANDF